MAYWRN